MEQRASSLQQRLEARRNMFLATKSGDGGGGSSGPSSIGAPQSTYISSRTGRNQIEISYYSNRVANAFIYSPLFAVLVFNLDGVRKCTIAKIVRFCQYLIVNCVHFSYLSLKLCEHYWKNFYAHVFQFHYTASWE